MPDETDRFSGLGSALEGGDETDETDDQDASESATGDASGDTASSPDTAEHPPPFAFDETELKSYYVRPETFDAISSARSIIRAVATKQGLGEDELAQSELQDAELSVLQSRDDWAVDVAMTVFDRRGIDVDEAEVRAVFDALA